MFGMEVATSTDLLALQIMLSMGRSWRAEKVPYSRANLE
jgi:hypothetical protein